MSLDPLVPYGDNIEIAAPGEEERSPVRRRWLPRAAEPTG